MLTFDILPFDEHLKEYAVYYNPLLDGIYIDLDNSVSTNTCQEVVGQVGLSPEFYFSDDALSKLVIEFPTGDRISLLNPNESFNIQDLIVPKAIRGHVKALTYPKLQEKSLLVTDLMVSTSHEFLVFFFDTYDPSLSVSIITSEDLSIVELNKSVIVGINRSDKTLYFICVINYLEKLSYSDFAIVPAELGEERFDSLKKIIKKTIDFSLKEADYLRLITRHQELYRDKPLNDTLKKSEERILDSLKKRHLFYKS